MTQSNEDALIRQINACQEIIKKLELELAKQQKQFYCALDNILILYNIMNISNEGIAITNRYFQTIDVLIAQKKTRGLAAIARECNQNRWNMVTLRNDPTRVMKPELLAHLVRFYNVSAEWLLVGKLPMFKD